MEFLAAEEEKSFTAADVLWRQWRRKIRSGGRGGAAFVRLPTPRTLARPLARPPPAAKRGRERRPSQSRRGKRSKEIIRSMHSSMLSSSLR